MYKVQVRPRARLDMLETANYISGVLYDPDAADALTDAVEESFVQLRRFPYSHPLHPLSYRLHAEIRFYPVENHVVFYKVREPEQIVEILHVWHERKNAAKLGE